MTDSILKLRDLSVSYMTPQGRIKALRKVNLSVPRGKIVGIVGESGCGKSTLLAATMGLLERNAEVDGGVIEFEGRDLLTLSSSEVRNLRGDRISIIFQDPMTTLNPVLSVGSQMTDVQFRQKTSRAQKIERSIEMLRRVGISDAKRRINDYPHQFSGGMCQRISIAMALQSEPTLLIADEPTTALDATLEVQILDRLRELQADINCTILFVSHHLGVIAKICDEVNVMYAGEVVEHGSVRDIFHHPAHPYTKMLLECDPARIKTRTAHLPTIPGDLPSLVELPEGCIFKDRCHWAFEPCGTAAPSLKLVNRDHLASCYLVGEH